jgi:hypothetical protein
MIKMLKTKLDKDIVAAFLAVSKNEVTRSMILPCNFINGYFVFPKSRIRNKILLKRLLDSGQVEYAD